VQTPQCLGFQIVKDKCYFIDHNKEVLVLGEDKDSSKLIIEKRLGIKEQEKISFKTSGF